MRTDLIHRAYRRERNARAIAGPDTFCSFAHAFECELCGRPRPEEDRREPASAICIQCERNAGFDGGTFREPWKRHKQRRSQ